MNIRRNEDDIVVIKVKTLYGIINLKFEIPFLDIVFINKKPALKYKADIESNKTNKLLKRISKIFSVDDFKNIKKYFRHDPIFLQQMKRYWSEKLSIIDFYLVLKYGTNDAALSALIYGALWTVLGTLLALMDNYLKFTTKDIRVIPCFDCETFKLEVSCIIKFKFGDIINTGIMLIRRRMQRKKTEQRLNNTLHAS